MSPEDAYRLALIDAEDLSIEDLEHDVALLDVLIKEWSRRDTITGKEGTRDPETAT